jgi:hypothetical protein
MKLSTRARTLPAALALGTLGAISVAPTPAHAAPGSWKASHHHGSGALAVHAEGGFRWLNRSVTMTNISLSVRQGECGRVYFYGFNVYGDLQDVKSTAQRCSGSHRPSDVTLVGGGTAEHRIQVVQVLAVDDTHQGGTWSEPYSR